MHAAVTTMLRRLYLFFLGHLETQPAHTLHRAVELGDPT